MNICSAKSAIPLMRCVYESQPSFKQKKLGTKGSFGTGLI